MKLRDGTVVPSFLGVKNTREHPEPNEHFHNRALRMGEVLDIIPPSDERSQSKKFNEYIVRIQNKSLLGESNTLEIRCFLASSFGGQADRLHYTFRTQKATGEPSETGLGLGSKVLVLCINGETNNAVIIGGLREGDNKDKEEGHHLHFEFNGVTVAIKDTGEVILQMVGPTNADGTLKDSASKTSTLSFTKDGVVSFDVEKGVHLGNTDANEALVMGTTYRQQQRSLHQQMMNDLVNLSTQMTAIGGAIAGAAGSLATAGGVMTTPVAGAIAAAPMVAAAGATLATTTAMFAAASALFTKMFEEINNFEMQADEYLSKKQTTD
jgi:hypothetical protein